MPAVHPVLVEEYAMKVRIKFSKQGGIKFIGHLDIMRYFQKLMKRAGIPIAYSEGMSPHQIMSFALPLGIGDESLGEYLDIELTGSVSSSSAISSLNKESVDEIRILSFKMLSDGEKNAMASVEAADYLVKFRTIPSIDLKERFLEFIKKESIVVLKKSKKNETEIDLKPFIFDYEVLDDSISLRVKCGSVNNIKPELVMQAFYDFLGIDFDEFNLLITRIDLLTIHNNEFVSLNDVGCEIN